MKAGAQLGCLAQRVQELLPTASALERCPRRGDGLHEYGVPERKRLHLASG
jgi:hypothetical protein